LVGFNLGWKGPQEVPNSKQGHLWR